MSTILLTIIIAIVLLFIMLLAMGIKVLFVKNGKFPSSHICKSNINKTKLNK